MPPESGCYAHIILQAIGLSGDQQGIEGKDRGTGLECLWESKVTKSPMGHGLIGRARESKLRLRRVIPHHFVNIQVRSSA
jgi:hypothetical protein